MVTYADKKACKYLYNCHQDYLSETDQKKEYVMADPEEFVEERCKNCKRYTRREFSIHASNDFPC